MQQRQALLNHSPRNREAWGSNLSKRTNNVAKPKVTIDQVMAAVEQDDCIGFCLECGAEASPVEPDARRYTCESCGKPRVYGAEELLLMMVS